VESEMREIFLGSAGASPYLRNGKGEIARGRVSGKTGGDCIWLI
jgi:hypothetical protein